MANLFFEEAERNAVKGLISKLEKANGVGCYSKLPTDNGRALSCDRYDCAVECDCAKTLKDRR